MGNPKSLIVTLVGIAILFALAFSEPDHCKGVTCGKCEKCEISALDNTTFCKSTKDDRCDRLHNQRGNVKLVNPANFVVCYPNVCTPHPKAICEVDECNSCSGQWKLDGKYLGHNECRIETTTTDATISPSAANEDIK